MSKPASNNTVKTLNNSVLNKMTLKELQSHKANVSKQMRGSTFGNPKKAPFGYLTSLNKLIKTKQLKLANQAENRIKAAKKAGRLA